MAIQGICKLFMSHFFSFFLRGKKKRNQTERKEKTRFWLRRYQGSAPNPVSSLCDLVGEFAHQLKGILREVARLSLPPAGERVASLLAFFFRKLVFVKNGVTM